MGGPKRLLVLALGWGFILLGLAGLVLPLLQGVLFLLVGLLILAPVSPWASRWLDRVKDRAPDRMVEAAESRREKWFGSRDEPKP